MKGDLYRAQRVLQLNHHEEEEEGRERFTGTLGNHWPSEDCTVITKEVYHPLSAPLLKPHFFLFFLKKTSLC